MNAIYTESISRITRFQLPNAWVSFSGWVQVAALIGIWMVSEVACRTLQIPLPGSVVGFFILWLLLESRLLPASRIERGADSLLNHLVLFFVPAMLALVGHPELLSVTGIKLFIAILTGTVIVMIGTALVIEAGFRLSAARSTQ